MRVFARRVDLDIVEFAGIFLTKRIPGAVVTSGEPIRSRLNIELLFAHQYNDNTLMIIIFCLSWHQLEWSVTKSNIGGCRELRKRRY